MINDFKTFKKKRILCPLHLPPPIYGSNISNNMVVKSKLLNEHFLLDVVPISYATNTMEIGKFTFKKVLLFFKYIYKIMCKINNKYDLIYFVPAVTGIAFYRDFIVLMLLKTFKTKILIHLRGKGIDKEARNNRFSRYLYKVFFNNTKVICLSGRLTYDIKNVYDGKPFIVNNCIENKQLPMKTIQNNPPVVLYLSNFIESKGILILLEAANILKKSNIDFRLHLIGAPIGNIMDKVNKLIEMYSLKSIILTCGPKYGKEKDELLVSSDILVFPTFYEKETWGLVILEAMQAGLPVISTNEGAIPEIVDDGTTGYIVRKKDPKDLADKLKILIEDEKLRIEMGSHGRRKYMEKYTYEIFEKRMCEVFNQIINQN